MILHLLSSLAIAHAGWEKLPPLPEPAGGFMAGCVNGKIIVAGGTNWRDGVKRWLDSVWLFDPANNTWGSLPALPHSLAYAACASDGTRLFFAGGADGKQGRREVDALDEKGQLTHLADLPQPVVFAGGTLLNGRLHLLGGTPDPDDWTKAHSLHQTVTLADGAITALPTLTDLQHGVGLPAMASAGGQVFAFTGAWFSSASDVHNLAEAFAFETSWQSLAPYPMAARAVSAIALDDTHIYLAGGYGTDEEGFLAKAWLYDTKTHAYLPAAPLPFAAGTCLVRCGEFIYCLGGEDQKKHRSDACYRIRTSDLLSEFEAPGTVTLNLEPTVEHPRNSEGSFATLASGRILFCYSQFYGGAADASPARIVRIHSDDQGRTWSAPVTVVENTGGNNVMSVSLLRLASGPLAMFYCVKNSWIDCRPHIRLSTDDGATWSEPRLVQDAPGYFVMNNDRVIQTGKGRLIMPLAFHRSRGTDPQTSKSWDARAIAMWRYSDDEGATWHESNSWWAMPVPSGSGLQEPGVVERADGTLFSWCRTDQGAQYGFSSTDAGKTWTPPLPTEMKSPNGPASIKRLPGSDDLLAIYNDHSGLFPFPAKKRNPFVAAISSDGGKTWPKRKLIESDPDGIYHYTAIHFVGDSVLLGYCAGDSQVGALNRLRIRRISLDWLRQP